MTEVIEMSESKMGLFNLLIGQLTSQWKSLMLDNDFNDDQVIKSIENRKLVLIEGLGFGPIYRKNLRYCNIFQHVMSCTHMIILACIVRMF